MRCADENKEALQFAVNVNGLALLPMPARTEHCGMNEFRVEAGK